MATQTQNDLIHKNKLSLKSIHYRPALFLCSFIEGILKILSFYSVYTEKKCSAHLCSVSSSLFLSLLIAHISL